MKKFHPVPIVALTMWVIVLAVCAGPLGPVLAAEAGSRERVAVLDFWAFDDDGRPVPRSSSTNIGRLTGVLPRAIAARLTQSERYLPDDGSILRSRGLFRDDPQSELESVRNLLAGERYTQVITGTLAEVERSVVVNVRRFVPGDDGPQLAGSAVAKAASAADAVGIVDTLLTELYPPEADVVNRPIARVVVVPNVLRLPVGGSANLKAYAIDELGRTIPSVKLIYQTDDASRATVNSAGLVKGLSPGRVQINLQPLGRSFKGDQLPQVDVSVVGPSLGMRVGGDVNAGHRFMPKVGLRLTPGNEIRPSRQPTQDIPQAGTNPTNYLTSFFASLLGNGLLTLDLDVVPSRDITVVLDAVQRSIGGYFGTGIGVTVPLSEDGPSGVNLRLTLGTQIHVAPLANFSLPVEFNTDFLLGGAQTPPTARVGVSFGIDIFQ